MTKENGVLIVIVLYKNKLFESLTYKSLKKNAALSNYPLNILVYDNSPLSGYDQSEENVNMHIRYIHDSSNSGLSTAYNTGLKIATDDNINWLLLLDQDTSVPEDYLSVFSNANLHPGVNDIVCAVPKVLAPAGITIISPIRIYGGAIFRAFKKVSPGIIKGNITGINSGTFLSVTFMNKLGGFDKRFPLDMLDHWYFSEIAKAKKKIFLLDATIYHNLSVNSFEREMSFGRYTNILNSERIFAQKSILSYAVFKLRLLKRLFQQIKYKEKSFFYTTLKNLV